MTILLTKYNSLPQNYKYKIFVTQNSGKKYYLEAKRLVSCLYNTRFDEVKKNVENIKNEIFENCKDHSNSDKFIQCALEIIQKDNKKIFGKEPITRTKLIIRKKEINNKEEAVDLSHSEQSFF